MSLLRRFASAALLLGTLGVLGTSGALTPSLAIAQTPSATAQASAASRAQAAVGDKIDINSATADQLKSIPGVGDAYAKRIIAGRPYSNKSQLTSKGVLPQGVYDKIKDRIIASQPKK